MIEYCSECSLWKDCKDYCDNARRYRQYIKTIRSADCRNKNLDPDSPIGKGYMAEALVSKFLGIPTCFDVTDNFSHPGHDILEHDDWGIINVKSSALLTLGWGYEYLGWTFGIKKNKYPDFFFCIGYDECRSHVKCVYYIPNEYDISDMAKIYINSSWSPEEDPYYWFKEDPKPWDDMLHTLKLDKCRVLRSKKTAQK